jgi:hypothetical protein
MQGDSLMEQSNVKIGDCGKCNRPVMSTHEIGSITYRSRNPYGQLGPSRSYLAHKRCADQAPVVQEYPVVVTQPEELLAGIAETAGDPPGPVPSMPVKEQKGQRKAPPAKKATPAATKPPEEGTTEESSDGDSDD